MNDTRSLLLSPTATTRFSVRLTVVTMLATALFLVIQYPELPWLLPVHFEANGEVTGWQYRTLPRVLMPVYVQFALAVCLGAVAMLLLSRPKSVDDPRLPEVRAARAAAEAVTSTALIWVAFQAYASVALVTMWLTGRPGLGAWYAYLQLVAFLLTGIVSVRGLARAGKPAPRPYVPEHWRFGQIYVNREDPSLFVPARNGSRWTLNFGRPLASALLGVILFVGVVGPTIILGLALRG